ncbi:hypothetical protein [Aeromicrobium sp. HA]|uniref:hypothetical protein n=1 Tax=Aeromicrobium sp. HA TaxID=3009077 RepID=UPI0022AE842C|nr:hypothetical protein [Aeromicrobium sp. HA]
MTALLLDDPTSQVHAAAVGWEYPLSREAAALADLFDAFAKANYKKVVPYPRPWSTGPRGRTVGKGTAMTPEEFHAAWAKRVAEVSSQPQ